MASKLEKTKMAVFQGPKICYTEFEHALCIHTKKYIIKTGHYLTYYKAFEK
jgi:hypothetical protein